MKVFIQILALAAIITLSHACFSDQVIKAMSSYPYTASAFCTGYIRPTLSETVISTTTLTTTLATVTPKATVVQTVTTLRTVTMTTLSTSTTSLYPAPIKRDLIRRQGFVPSFLANYPPFAISSACSCFITPLPTPTPEIVSTIIYTREIAATRTLNSTLTISISSTATQTSTAYAVQTTVVPNCAPIQGCILANSSWIQVPWEFSQTDGLWCEDYCRGIGGCLGYQIGANTTQGSVCNILGLAAWRAWDRAPAAVGSSLGVGGGNCSSFWIYERACDFVVGFPWL